MISVRTNQLYCTFHSSRRIRGPTNKMAAAARPLRGLDVRAGKTRSAFSVVTMSPLCPRRRVSLRKPRLKPQSSPKTTVTWQVGVVAVRECVCVRARIGDSKRALLKEREILVAPLCQDTSSCYIFFLASVEAAQ